VVSPELRSDRSAPRRWRVPVCLFCVYIIWGTTYYALKVGLEGAGPYFLIGTRFVVAGGLTMAWLRLRGQPLPTARQWRGAAVLAFLLLVVSLGNITVAEKWVTSGATVALVTLVPLAVALWSVVLGSRPKALEWAAIVMGSAGTFVMIMGEDLRAQPLGTVLILIGIASWSLGTVVSKRIETPPGAMGFAAEMLAGGVMALVLSAVFRESWYIEPAARVLWAWGYLVVFGSLIGFSAYRYLVDEVSPTLATSYAYVNPLVGLLVGWGLGHETFSANVLIGLPIVLASVGALAWAQFRRPAMDRAGQRRCLEPSRVVE
jgi:drug/metabolite transporter (DMT)-like permease